VLVGLFYSPSYALESVTLQLKWTHQFQFSGYYAAKEQGYYREAGLDLNIVSATPETNIVNEVLSGRADFAVGSSNLILDWYAGKPVVVLGVIFQHSAYVLLVRKQSETQSVHNLINKRLMVESLSDEVIVYLKREGVTLADVQLLDHTLKVESLIKGEVDAMSAYVTDEPYELDAQEIPYFIYTPRSAGVDFYGDNLFTSEIQIAEHPDRVRAFRNASFRGWQYAMAHPEEIADLILRDYETKKTRDQLLYEHQKMQELLHPELIAMGYMYSGRWQHIAQTYAELGMLPDKISLHGFLYEPYPDYDLRKTFTVAAGLLVLLAVVSIVALRFFRLNKALDNLLYLKSRHANIGQAIDNISHQWKQPLNELGIQQMLIEQAVSVDPVLAVQIQPYIAKSHRVLGFMADTVETFRHYFTHNHHSEKVDLAECVRQTLLLVESTFNQSGTIVHFDAGEVCLILANEIECSHVLLSILVNAQDIFSERQIDTPEITIQIRKTKTEILLSIQDNGGGIQVKPIKLIFSLGYSRTKDRDSGLGLYLAKRIVKQKMHASIQVENKNGGALFSIKFPLI